MKCLRFVGLLQISWTEKKNKWMGASERQLLKAARKRKMTYFEHIIRKKDKCLEKDIIQVPHRVTAQGRAKNDLLR